MNRNLEVRDGCGLRKQTMYRIQTKVFQFLLELSVSYLKSTSPILINGIYLPVLLKKVISSKGGQSYFVMLFFFDKKIKNSIRQCL